MSSDRTREITMRVALALVVATSVTSCSKPTPAPEPVKPPTNATPPPPPSNAKAVAGDVLARLALDQTGELARGTSFADWRAAHADDTTAAFHAWPVDASNPDWCARSIGTVTIDEDRVMTRMAYFYPPPTPDTLTMPSDPPDRLIDQCRLGLIWIETADGDARKAAGVAGDVNKTIAATLGTPDTTVKPIWTNSNTWKRNARWTASDVTMVMATSDWRADEGPKPTRIFVAAAGPASGIRFAPGASRLPARDEFLGPHRIAAARIDEAMKLADRNDDAAERAMFTSLTLVEDKIAAGVQLAPGERTALLDALDLWLNLPADFPAQRRAAALIAADLLLNESSTVAGLKEPKNFALRKRLVARGAAFAPDPFGSEVVSSRAWLRQVERMNPGGRPGELAFISLMTAGFDTTGNCGDPSGENLREIIKRGEDYARTHANSGIRSDIRYVVAQAQADLVRLGDGGGGEAVDAVALSADADKARKAALEELGQVFSNDAGSPLARALWPTAWRLAAGLSPARSYFFCGHD